MKTLYSQRSLLLSLNIRVITYREFSLYLGPTPPLHIGPGLRGRPSYIDFTLYDFVVPPTVVLTDVTD